MSKIPMMKILLNVLFLLLVSCGKTNPDNKTIMESSTDLYNTFDKDNHLRPDFSKSIFDSLHSWDFGWAMLEPINIASDNEKEMQLSKRLSPGQKALYFFWYLDADVTNGGFIQFYWNDRRKYLAPIMEGLKLIGDKELLNLVEKVDKQYIVNKSLFDFHKVKGDDEPLYDSLKDFDIFDNCYYRIHNKSMDLIEQYAREHPNQFVNLN